MKDRDRKISDLVTTADRERGNAVGEKARRDLVEMINRDNSLMKHERVLWLAKRDMTINDVALRVANQMTIKRRMQ